MPLFKVQDEHGNAKYRRSPSGVLQRPCLNESGLFWQKKVRQHSIGQALLCVRWHMKDANAAGRVWSVCFRCCCCCCRVVMGCRFCIKYVFSLFSLSAGEEGVVFSHSVETSHVRAEPFQDLKWVCVRERERKRQHFSTVDPSIVNISVVLEYLWIVFLWTTTETITPQITIGKSVLGFSCEVVDNWPFLRYMVFS